jgi:hypothetical protein
MGEHLITALRRKICTDLCDDCDPDASPLPARAQHIFDLISQQFSACQAEVFVGNTRINQDLWAVQLSRMRLNTAVIESLPYALRNIGWSQRDEDEVIGVFVTFKRYVTAVVSRTQKPDHAVEQLGREYGYHTFLKVAHSD